MLPPDGGPEFNRLIHQKSPYLLQHARNPVDWYPWGGEALARAKAEDKPIFLSVGYSSCHWCHVMERESFQREDIAALLNENFIAIKVDREERPDIDQIYMTATQLLTGRGGWPNSVWLTPDGKPWYAGTYFPPEDRLGRPGFKTLLSGLVELWRTRREQVERNAEEISQHMRQIASQRPSQADDQPTRNLAAKAVDQLRGSFDQRLGGFGAAPKFPPHGSLGLLFYQYRQTKDASLLHIATHTLAMMARGGIHDHVGGGFHRYSTDAEWLLPHFEKMLYDNAQLSRAYVDAHILTGEDDYRRVAVDIYEWVLREMTGEEGGFYSALDADSDGEEGKFYLWRRDEIISTLGQEEGELFCRVYSIEQGGNFRDQVSGQRPGTNIVHLKDSLAQTARSEGIAEAQLGARLAAARRKLLERRNQRIWPALDDKVLTAWNGLMIGSLAYGGRQLAEPRYIKAAQRAADFVLAKMRRDGRLLRTYRQGQAAINAYLDDYAFLASGLIELYESTGAKRYLDQAEVLMTVLLDHYHDQANGGFFFTSDDHEDLLLRTRDPFDKAIPSGNGVAAGVLVRLWHRTGKARYRQAARQSLDAFLPLMHQSPRSTESLILAASMYLDKTGSGTATATSATAATTQRKPAQPDARSRQGPVYVEAFASRLTVRPGQLLEVALRLMIDPGWHINSRRPLQQYLVPTTVRLQPHPSARLAELAYPDGERISLSFSPEPLSVYQGQLWLRVPVAIAGDAKAGAIKLVLEVLAQPCNDKSCLAPHTHSLPITVEVNPAAEQGKIRHQDVFERFAKGSIAVPK